MKNSNSARSTNSLPRMAATKLYPFFSWLSERGHSREAVCLEAGIPLSLIEHPDSMISLPFIEKVLNAAWRLSKDDYFGLHAGSALNKGFAHLVGYIMLNSPTLHHALDRFIAFERLVDMTSVTACKILGDEAQISVSLEGWDRSSFASRQFIEYRMAGCHAYAAFLGGTEFQPFRLEFAHAAPADIREYRRIFGCPVYFGRAENIIIFPRSFLNYPVREPNPDLLALFETKAAEIAETVSLSGSNQEGGEISRKVSQSLLRSFPTELPEIGVVADNLAMSVRNLQIKLRAEGTTYRQLFERIRRASAMQFLRDGSMAIGEIAYLTGFSEPSAFHRSFKRWTGKTPGEFRAEV